MLFNSYLFIFVFLPLTILGYFFLVSKSKKIAQIFLIIMSLWFYGYFNYSYLIIICGSILFNFMFFRILLKHKNKLLLVLGTGANVGVIFYYKYFNF